MAIDPEKIARFYRNLQIQLEGLERDLLDYVRELDEVPDEPILGRVKIEPAAFDLTD